MTQLLIVGMPASGKSTYIAALRHLLLAREVPTELELTTLADEESHLNRLETEWLACREIARTKASTEAWVRFNVRDRVTGGEASLSIPDLRGEAFEQPATSSQCRKALYDTLKETDGILLFTNVDREDDTLMIDEMGDILENGEGFDLPMPAAPFRAENMPEEAKIVEFLQVANRRPQRARKRKIAILGSAWDVVSANFDLTPAAWLEINRPMLAQFLATNPNLWECRVYGVSPQGGKLPEKKKELEQVKHPSERILVVGHEAGAHDLTAPLRWLMATE